MAHFAQLDNDGIVLQILVISNDDLLDKSGIEKEEIGIEVCKTILGKDTHWVQTSYNGNFRGKYAAIGDKYEKSVDKFYTPIPPFPSWKLSADFEWQPPVPKPTDDKHYYWDESSIQWLTLD